MRRSSERSVRGGFAIAFASVLTAACGQGDAPEAGGSANLAPTSPVVAAAAEAGEVIARAPAAASAAFEGRTRELVNPDASALVFLYYDLTGLTPPYDAWVERDSRVTLAQAIDRQARREAVRAELEAAAGAVRGVGALRITMHANLSDYDPSYSEFTVRALAPSSVVEFSEFQQKISIRFGNGLAAQTWRVAAEDAQLIRDKIGHFGGVSLDVLLRITDVQPAPGGGTLTADVVEYELRSASTGQLIGRVVVTR